MADTPTNGVQHVIVYQDPDGGAELTVYTSVYDDEQAESAILDCEARHGHLQIVAKKA
jgi:hypothetical protein